jgi:rRNA-processing protein EBP2
MGKKDGKRRRSDSDDFDDDELDPELEAEMAALEAIKNEKYGDRGNNPSIGTVSADGAKKIYNREGLLQAAEAIGQLPFIESFQISDFPIDLQDMHDDLEREMAFYNQTVMALREGRRRLESLGVPMKRPSDYFCENVKSDAHMSKVCSKPNDWLVTEPSQLLIRFHVAFLLPFPP